MSKLKDLELLFAQGKISRREFMAQVSALGLAAAVSPALLATPAQAATPKKGGLIASLAFSLLTPGANRRQ